MISFSNRQLRRIMVGVIAGLIFYLGVLPAQAKKHPPVQRDIKYILGLYYGNGENILIREAGGELELLYRLPGDKNFDKFNTYNLQKHRFDSYTLYEAGPMSHFGEVGVKFERDEDGYGVTLRVGGHLYTRMFFPGEKEADIGMRFAPRNDWDELRSQAERISMPLALQRGSQEQLVNLANIKGLKLQNVYATSENIFGAPLYSQDKLYLNRSCAFALARAKDELAKSGLGLVVWDAYRPWSVSKLASMALPEKQKDLLEDPDRMGSPHNTGNAVDVGLYDLATGEVLELTSGFDEPSIRQYSKFPGGTTQQRAYRALLREAMEKAGFSGIEQEWWHFHYKKDVEYAHLNIPLENLK